MIYNINNFDYSLISKSKSQRRKKGNQGKRNNKRVYKDLICAFDIETTNDRESVQAFMYVWQFQIDDITIMGRTWNEFITMLQRMANELNRDQYIVIFVQVKKRYIDAGFNRCPHTPLQKDDHILSL